MHVAAGADDGGDPALCFLFVSGDDHVGTPYDFVLVFFVEVSEDLWVLVDFFESSDEDFAGTEAGVDVEIGVDVQHFLNVGHGLSGGSPECDADVG